jgi:hypothetical protein
MLVDVYEHIFFVTLRLAQASEISRYAYDSLDLPDCDY